MMKKYSFAFYILFIIGSLSHKLKASHYTSGEIYYKYIGDSTGVANQYQVFVKLYRKVSGTTIQTNTSQPLCISSSCYQDSTINLALMLPPTNRAHPLNANAWKLPDFDLCVNANAAVDITVAKYSGSLILPPCADYKLKLYGQCCRDNLDNLDNSSSTRLFLQANLNNSLGHNSSPQIISPAGRTFCISQAGQAPVFYPHPVIENDGDSLVYSLETSQEPAANADNFNCGAAVNIPYRSGFTANNPIPSSTGTSLNTSNGLLRFSPSLTGNYQVKIDVNEFRFDTISLQWLNVGKTTRDFTVHVVSSCGPQIIAGPKLKNIPSPSSLQSLFTSEIDSMKLAYGVPQIKGSDSIITGPLTLVKLPFNHGYSCFDTILDLTFNNHINYQSLDPTDIRLIGPDGVPRPVVGVKDLNTISSSDRVQLILHQPLDTDGNYLVQFKTGLDGNTLVSECGYPMEEFYSAIMVVDSCPEATYELASASVTNNEFVRLQWSVNNGFNDPRIIQNFDSWIIHRREPNSSLMSPLKVINDPSVRFFTDSLPASGYPVSNAVYDYALLLKHNGKRREMTRTCSNIKLNATPSGPGLNNLFLSWNHYNCLDPNNRVYKIYRGMLDTNTNTINWQQQGDMTSLNNYTAALSSINSLSPGTYAFKVVAQKPKSSLAQDFSESNWVYFYHNPSFTISRKNKNKISIPNIITPNNDGLNDKFYISAENNDDYIKSIGITIYRSNGDLVYQNENYNNSNNSVDGWEGQDINGDELPNGVYFYVLEINSKSPENRELSQGSVTISR